MWYHRSSFETEPGWVNLESIEDGNCQNLVAEYVYNMYAKSILVKLREFHGEFERFKPRNKK
jgi:hypothetical protein